KVWGAPRRLSIRLPAEYTRSSTATFPVVYLVDGGPEQDFPHIAGLLQSREVNHTFAPFILVGVETVQRRRELTPPAQNADVYERLLRSTPGSSSKFRRFVKDEVMPWVNQRFRTSGRTAVIGESLAGLFIVETLFSAPDLFDDYIAVSPSLWWEEAYYGREARQYLQKLPPGQRRLYLTMGNEGFMMQRGLDLLVEALESTAPSGLAWAYVPKSDRETHASIYHGAALDAFRLLFPTPTRVYPPMPLMVDAASRPPLDMPESERNHRCTLENSRRGTPADTRVIPLQGDYTCWIYDLGDRAAAGKLSP
ncbi:MAG: alpha/beta hydrolase-fold protein, partial [Myxococcota bacterium]